MSGMGDLQPRAVATPDGEIELWGRPEIYGRDEPLVLALGSGFSPIEDLKNLPDVLGFLADGCLMRTPGAGAPRLRRPGVDPIAKAVGHLLETVFAGRPVVLLGVSIGGVVALSVRASNLVRVVAIEPPLMTGDLWPIVGPLRDAAARDEPVRDMAWNLFGISATAHEPRDYSGALDDLPCPADVLLGDTPLMPQREVRRFPSLVDAAARARLAAAPNVRLHIAAGAGHNVVAQAPKAVQDVLMESVRRAGAAGALADRAVDEPLLDATPLSARRLLVLGPRAEAFGRAFRRADPKASVEAAQGPGAAEPGARFDAVVADAPLGGEELAAVAARLAAGGHLIARWAQDRAGLAAALAPHGLFLRAPVDAAGTGVVRAQKCAEGRRPAPPLSLHTLPYATTMMDIRTRLPARALASDPELDARYLIPPARLPDQPFDTPKVVVLQRCAELKAEWFTPILASAIRAGRLVVAEYDDHPWLISEVLGHPGTSPQQMIRFGYVHGVQTTTPPLVEAFRPYNPEVVAFPNAAFSLAPFPAGERPRRVLYGAVLRGDYGVAVARSLGPAIAQFPDTEFVVLADEAVFEALPTKAKTFHGYMSFEAYLRIMETCSISLTPIAPLPMRETKSDAKFVDAGRSGALTIASPTVYDRVIQHGENGLIAREVEDWAPLLAQALGDQALRERLARRAWEYVRDERMFADQIAVRRAWYLDLWSRREALNAALIARTPGLREALAA